MYIKDLCEHGEYKELCSDCLNDRIKQLEKLLRMTFECEDNRCDRCKGDIKKVLEDKDE